MSAQKVTIIFDVGKTNKKLYLFDEDYQVVFEEHLQIPETADEDGFPCEDVNALSDWLWQGYWRIYGDAKYNIIGVNFSAYGASFVHLNDSYKPFTPLYNYLKPYPDYLEDQFYSKYGGENTVAMETASPVLGSLNSGMQLYRLKYEKPDIYKQINFSLHLPQYLSFIISSVTASDITSVGCHTHLWNFSANDYHDWIVAEGIRTKLAPLFSGDDLICTSQDSKKIPIGIGLHDSSAALIPYLSAFSEPFILLSTGTWCISLNPFNSSSLTNEELQQDCLCYLTYQGKPVKASRLFAGHWHEEQIKIFADHYNKNTDYYKTIRFDPEIIMRIQSKPDDYKSIQSKKLTEDITSPPKHRTFEEAYHHLILGIVYQQVISTRLVLKGSDVKKIFVDGGFSNNFVFMHLLTAAFPHMEVFAATISQASALGAALAIHKHWNTKTLPADLIKLKRYAVPQGLVI